MATQASNVQLYEHRPYSQEEVNLLNWFELYILRNELFAMQGYVFSTEWLAAYFECTPRAAFRGTLPTLKLEIYDGPYSNLPLSIEINNEDIGGYERYEELFGNRY